MSVERPTDSARVAAAVLALARQQTRALYAEDFAAFRALADERDALVARLAVPLAAGVRATLERVAAIDRENEALVRALLAETARALQRLREGRVALRGYATPAQVAAAPRSALDRRG
ncbi:MAG TPA: hypothetical protein VKZ60_05030 [Chloroflexota bacterium]|jgi:hypothetical protein|nr:hypothetical protein [Chloroflexota bacterium]